MATEYPKISEKDLHTIEAIVLLQSSQKDNPKVVIENLTKLQKQLPDIESGKMFYLSYQH